jgi:hypothetical protein
MEEEEGYGFRSIAVSEAEQFLIAAKSNGSCLVFDYAPDRPLSLITQFEAHKTYVTKCVLSPEQK